MQLTDKQVLAIKRKRGELDYSISMLANTVNIDRHTLSKVLKNGQRKVNKPTFEKLNNWLIDQYTNV
ncbi:XRE family transcriptional regulator [Lactobacillus sp. PSON]|uniref:XRE family transcriptional regulator n=1 Tax=Lactobacillus sp. PSON TaxID=3455454 RepID=UPI004042C6D4